MPRSVDLYLSDLLEASSDILRFTNGVDFAAYKSNRLLRAAAERLFTIIGEAMRQLEQHHPQYLHGILEARKIIDFRNVVVHEYATVDDEEVWSAIQSKLPAFRNQIAALIQARQPPA
jgi:uncharacterized protein with HEPN domain